jgi:hypothetical protein
MQERFGDQEAAVDTYMASRSPAKLAAGFDFVSTGDRLTADERHIASIGDSHSRPTRGRSLGTTKNRRSHLVEQALTFTERRACRGAEGEARASQKGVRLPSEPLVLRPFVSPAPKRPLSKPKRRRNEEWGATWKWVWSENERVDKRLPTPWEAIQALADLGVGTFRQIYAKLEQKHPGEFSYGCVRQVISDLFSHNLAEGTGDPFRWSLTEIAVALFDEEEDEVREKYQAAREEAAQNAAWTPEY